MQKRPFHVYGYGGSDKSADKTYETMFPETAAELWGKENLKPGNMTTIYVDLGADKSPLSLEVSRDESRVWVKRAAITL